MSVVLGIALICIAILIWPTGTTKDAKKQQTDIHFKINEIGTQVADESWQPIVQGLVAYWKFDEGSGTTATSSRGGNTGNLTGGPTWTTNAKSGQALNFNGNRVNIPDVTSGLGEASFSLWFYRTAAGSGYEFLITDYSSTFEADYNTGNNFLQFYTNNVALSYSMASNPPLNRWVHVAGTMSSSGNFKRLYVNGTQVASTTFSGTIGAHDTKSIGQRRDGTYAFNGTIDEVMIFNRALTANEIRLLYENPGYPQ